MRKANFRRAVRDWFRGEHETLAIAFAKEGLGRKARERAERDDAEPAARKPAPTRRRKVRGGRPAESYRGAKRNVGRVEKRQEPKIAHTFQGYVPVKRWSQAGEAARRRKQMARIAVDAR